MKPENSLVFTVLFCHFLASFTALGMPLFLPKVMQDLIGPNMNILIGWYYILPTVCTALVAAWWGRFADKYGKRLSLLRAQLGLAAGFMIAGLANDLMTFTLGLLIQGICGGTYAASNAYLATQVDNKALPKVLNWTQFSARLSLLLAPIIFGLLISSDNPRELYCYLAILPVMAAILVGRLPIDGNEKVIKQVNAQAVEDAPLSFNQILCIQFLFSFSMVVSFPYFLPFAESLGIEGSGVIAWYFSMPHLVYLLITCADTRWQQRLDANHWSSIGLFLLVVSALLHQQIDGEKWLWLARIFMGVGITLTYVGIHHCFSALKTRHRSGLIFGRFDSAGKWAGVFAGVSSGLIVEWQGLKAPFSLSAGTALLALFVIYFPKIRNFVRCLPGLRNGYQIKEEDL
ncbi:MFS transporter [Aliikangiella sp. G2MR2-5]|uniref:MFS transporter n=1 Tax=Aliikangiella sp. G2MR2-5 TaxID=2788943 RepID=UPI0018AB6AEF|nr:MFS transporter [Aliikangiella sp. G2MR2-5]